MQDGIRIEAKAEPLLRQEVDAVVLGLFEGEKVRRGGSADIDRALKGVLKKVIERGQFKGKYCETLFLPAPPGPKFGAVLLVGLGGRGDLDARRLKGASLAAGRRFSRHWSTKAPQKLSYTGSLSGVSKLSAWRTISAERFLGTASMMRSECLRNRKLPVANDRPSQHMSAPRRIRPTSVKPHHGDSTATARTRQVAHPRRKCVLDPAATATGTDRNPGSGDSPKHGNQGLYITAVCENL